MGRDSRLSGNALSQAVIEGIAIAGCRVYDFGIASTPAMFISTVTDGFNCDGAIMLTASHLPFNRNGLKFFTPQGGLGKPDISDILAISSSSMASLTAEAKKLTIGAAKGEITQRDFMTIYAARLVETVRQ